MVRSLYLFILLLILAGPGQAFAASVFTAKLSKTTIELGKYTHLILTSTTLLPSLRSVNLSVLEDQFYVDASADINTLNQKQYWRIRLYPRRRGKLTLPALHYAQFTSAAKQVNVKPAMDAETGQSLNIESSMSAKTALVNQQVLVPLSVLTKEQHVVLETTTPALASGTLHRLKPWSVVSGDAGLIHHNIGWAYFPTKPGAQTLPLPAVNYKRDGVITHRFYLPVQKLLVRPLPLYVPSNFPVGKLSLQVTPSSLVLLSGRLRTINVTLQAEAILLSQLPHLENYLQTTSGLQLYPASITSGQTAGPDGIKSEVHLQIPVKAAHTGLYQLKDINLQYFEPLSGKIKTLHYQWPTLFFISPWLLSMLGLLLMLLLAFGLLRLYHFARQRLYLYQCWQRARQRLLAATTPQEIKSAIMLMSRAEQGIDNTTLQRWPGLKDIDIEPLSQALYCQRHYDVQQLKKPYLQLCHKGLKLIFWSSTNRRI